MQIHRLTRFWSAARILFFTCLTLVFLLAGFGAWAAGVKNMVTAPKQSLAKAFSAFKKATPVKAPPMVVGGCTGTSPNIVCGSSNTSAITLNGTTTGGYQGGGATFTNPQRASVYPSTNIVSGLTGTVSSVAVRLNGLTTDWGYDLNMLLVSPSGQQFIFWSNIGPSNNGSAVVLNNNTFTISDGAASDLPQGTPANGSYKPKNYGTFTDIWPATATNTIAFSASTTNSASPFGNQTLASRFNGENPNGTWNLYLTVTGTPDTGSLQSWDLIFATQANSAATTTTLTSSANPVQIPLSGNSTATVTATVTSSGNPVTLGAVSFFEGAQALATNVPVNASGQASFTFNTVTGSPLLTEGVHNITANYSGATGFGASSGSLTQTVDRATTVSGNTFCNTGKITIPQALNGSASVYPSKIFVSGLSGVTQSVVMQLKGFTNPVTDDVNMLLVSPTGQKFVPFAYVSSETGAASNANITLDDAAGSALPNSGPLVTGTYRPGHLGVSSGNVTQAVTFVSPAPAAPYKSPAPHGSDTFASTFAGASPNGTWTLYVINWANTPGAGLREITNGWCLTIGTSSDPATTTTVSVTPSPSTLNQSATVSALVVNASNSSPVNAQGTVTFKEGNTVLAGPINVDSNGMASFTTSTLTQGAHTITANYSGAPGFFALSSGTVLHYVDAPTTNPTTGQLCNTTAITIPNSINGSGSPYPTRVNVSGLAGTVQKVTVSLNGFSHQFPDDVDLMLTGPNGRSLVLLSDVGGSNAVSGLNLTLDSTAASALPDSTALTSGTFRPTDFEAGTDTFASPAPTANVFSASTTTLGSAFNNIDPNGLWTLWVANDNAGVQGGGSLSGGWCLNFTMNQPQLTVSKTHSGNFTQGQSGAQYTVTVGSSGPGNTAGTISLVDNVPAGLTISGMSGNGWTCNTATATCTTNAVLAANGTLPPITVTVNVAANAPANVANSVTASGGGAQSATASDPTTINQLPDLTITKTTTASTFQQGDIAVFTVTVTNIGNGPTTATFNVTDVMPTGLQVDSLLGLPAGFDCSAGGSAQLSCTSTSALAAGASRSVQFNGRVSLTAPTSITNTATVSGGGESVTNNNSGSVTFSVTPTPKADLTVNKSASGTMTQGGTGNFTVTVNNIGEGASNAPYTVTDTMPTGLTAGTPSGPGWNCSASTPTVVSCVRFTSILAGASAPAITIPVNVAANAPASITNTASVSGGGETNTGNNSGSVTVTLCPTSFTVNDLGDTPDATPGDKICADANGKCTLRAAVMEANAITACSPLTINFSVTGVVNLASALPVLNHPNLTINGPGANLLTVRRDVVTAFRIFTINSGKTVTLNGLTISNGSATSGGGLSNNGTLTLNQCVVSGNTATSTGSSGGGIQNQGVLTLTDSALTGNSAALIGGGLWNVRFPGNPVAVSATLTNCTLAGNQAASGGALHNQGTTVSLTNCTLSGNTANIVDPTGGGAGLENVAFNFAATATLVNCTFNGNQHTNSTDPTADDIYSGNFGFQSTVTLKNTILGGSAATATPNLRVYSDGAIAALGVINSLGNNLSSDNGSGFLTGAGDLVNTNPLLSVLGNYGGLTTTHALLPGSPAINAGNNTGAPTTDQRGIARPQQTTVDIGAFESQGFTLAVNSGSPQSTIINTNFALPLKVNVTPVGMGEPVDGGQVTFTPPMSPVTATVAGSPATITGGMATSGTVTANGTTGGYNVAASAKGASSINFALTNNIAPTVQQLARGNSSPTNASSVTFNLLYSESVTNATVSNFTLVPGGSVAGAMITGVACNMAAHSCVITVNTGTGSGTLGLNMTNSTGVMDSDGAGLSNLPFTGEVYNLDKAVPMVAFSSAAPNPTNVSPIPVTVTFSENVIGFTAGDITTSNGTVNNFMGSGAMYTFDLVPAGQGLVTADIAANVAQDVVGNGNTAATQFSRTYDTIAPTVTVNQASGQADPTSNSPINFTVVFSQAVTGFGNSSADVTLSGTAGATTTVVTEIAPNNGTTYNVAVSGMSAGGTILVTIPAGAAQDLATNPSAASTSMDNTVTYITCPSTLTVNDLGDTPDATPGNGVCADSTGKCTLRAAIQEANALVTPVLCSPLTINFSVTGVINLGAALPTINHPSLVISGPGANQLDVHRNVSTLFRIFTINSGKTVTLSGMSITNGDVRGLPGNGSIGGGILSFGNLSINNCAISGNHAGNNGGISQINGTLNVTNSTISGNTSIFQAGGIYTQNSIAVNLTNSTISGNICSSEGGGIFAVAAAAGTYALTLTNCTITNNTSGPEGNSSGGGGIAIYSANTTNPNVTASLKNTIVASNTPDNFKVDLDQGSLNANYVSLGNNLDSDGTSGFTNGANGDLVGTSGNPINALLAALGNYGSPTQTHALLPGSPAINAGNNTGAPTTDQRGIARPQQSTVDIGAFESQGFTLAVNSGNNQTTAVTTPFANPLAVTVTSSFNEPVNGGQVTFTPPGSGASATLAGNPATITGGVATSGTVTANATAGGSYTVAATATGAPTAANFSLTNTLVPVTVNVPAGITYTLNGQTLTGTQTVQVAPGTYTLATTTPQSLGTGVRAVFSNWSDAGAISHSVTVGSNPLTITGTFTTQYQLTTAVTPSNGGNVTPATGTFYDSGTVVNVSATANPNFAFTNWTGSVANANSAATTVTMDAPKSITANFAAFQPVTITVPAGIQFNFNGTTYTGTQTINVAPGTYTLVTSTPQSLGAGTRAVFNNWSDAGAISHSITVTASPVNITGIFKTQYQLTTAAGTGGSVSPTTGNFYDTGTVVNVVATPDSGYAFVNWTGPVAVSSSAATTVTMDAPKSITANFGLIPPLNAQIGDPFVCNGIGSSIQVTATLKNPNIGSEAASFNVNLPSMLTLVPGSCVASNGVCNPVSATQLGWMGNLAGGETLTITYQAQIADSTPLGTLITIDSVGTVASVTATVSASGTVSCPAANLNNDPVNVALSDQKAGSVLVFPYYTSKASTKADTRLSISNVGTQQAYAHIFLLDGATCQQADYSVCLTPNGSFTFTASEVDPETTGWVLVVAVDANGLPIQNNALVGNAFLKDGLYVGNYGAEAFWANSTSVATVNGNLAKLRFDDTGYDAVPNQFAVEVQSPRDVVGQKVVTVGMSGDLNEAQLTGAGQLSAGLAYNANENPFGSFVGFLTGNCQASAIITPTNPRLPFTMGGIVPSGQAGTLKFKIGSGVGLLLTPQNATKWSGIRGLHKTSTTFTTITIPLSPPIC